MIPHPSSPDPLADVAVGGPTVSLSRTLADAKYILWDFDGPLTRLFAKRAGDSGYRGPIIAERLKEALKAEHVALDAFGLEPCGDPHEIYRVASANLLETAAPGPYADLIARMRQLLDEFEVDSARTAVPTPGAEDLVRELVARGKRLAVTSNNCHDAIDSYLRREDVGLIDWFRGPIIGRADDARLMKPDPSSLFTAIRELGRNDSIGIDPGDCLMIGDSPADARAALAAKVVFCGYARNDRKLAPLLQAGAHRDLVVDHLSVLTAALRDGGPAGH